MNKKMTRFLVILAVVLVGFVVIAFVIPFARTGVFWIALAFGLVAIASQLYIQPKAFGGKTARSKFYGFPIGHVGILYLSIQLILSVVAMAMASVLPPWAAVVIFVLLFGAAVVGFVVADATRDEIERQDAKLKTDVTAMRALQSLTASIAAQCEDQEAKRVLTGLAQKFRFSDPVSSEATREAEENLKALVEELQAAVLEGDVASVRPLAARIDAALAERNRLCRINK